MSPCATAEQALHDAHPRTLRTAVAIAILVHAVAFVAVPDMTFEPYSMAEEGPPPLRPVEFVIEPPPRLEEVRKPPVVREFEPVDDGDAEETIDGFVHEDLVNPVPLFGEKVRRDTFRSFDVPPVLVHRVEPSYPDLARQAELEGEVGLLVVVSESGGVERAQVVRSVPGLDAAAVEAVLRWEFEPA